MSEASTKNRPETSSASRSFSLAELLVSMTAAAMITAIGSQATYQWPKLPTVIVLSACALSILTGAILGGVTGFAQSRRRGEVFLLSLIGSVMGLLGALALMVRLNWPQVVFGSFIICFAALVCRLMSTRGRSS